MSSPVKVQSVRGKWVVRRDPREGRGGGGRRVYPVPRRYVEGGEGRNSRLPTGVDWGRPEGPKDRKRIAVVLERGRDGL